MSSVSAQSTALLTYGSFQKSTFSWSNFEQIQEHVIKKSFKVQVADYSYFHRNDLRNVIQQFSFFVNTLVQSHAKSLDSTISDVRNLAYTQYFFQALKNRFGSHSIQFSLVSRQNEFFLNRTIAIIGTFSLKDLEDRRREISHLFFEILLQCDYDRSLIVAGNPLESVLDNSIYTARYQIDTIDFITGRKIHETVKEALFARRLGVELEEASSKYHPVYYILDRSRKRLGVFKPAIHINPLGDRYGASEDREAHLAEAANSVVDRFLGTRVVPYTQLLKYNLSLLKEDTPVIGSFQFYLDGAYDLDSQLEGENRFDPNHEELSMRLDTLSNRELEFRNFEEFAFFDLITANNDHHFKNILLKKHAEKVWDLVAIDNANSFPWCHDLDLPSYKIHPKHWFKWSALPQAMKEFSDSMIERINRLNMDLLEEIIRNELVTPYVPSSEEHIEGKIKTLRDRFNRIKLLANKKASLRAIAKDLLAYTQEDSKIGFLALPKTNF